MYKILIADDHPLFRDAIKSVIYEKFPGSTVLETSNFYDSLQLAEENHNIDLVLLDLNMPGMEGLTGIVKMRNNHPEIPLGIISAEEDKSVVLQTVGYGAVGFITKSTSRDNMANAITQILNGQVYLPADIIRSSTAQQQNPWQKNKGLDPKTMAYLTRKQLQVFERMAKGKSNKQIAYEMNIAETTVKAHVSAILHKLNVKNRIQAVLSASNIDFDQYLHHPR